MPGFAYENLALMSAHGDLDCSPAGRMDGGDYDGDKVSIVVDGPIVNSVQVQDCELRSKHWLHRSWLRDGAFYI